MAKKTTAKEEYNKNTVNNGSHEPATHQHLPVAVSDRVKQEKS
jgi:hypothetical protein